MEHIFATKSLLLIIALSFSYKLSDALMHSDYNINNSSDSSSGGIDNDKDSFFYNFAYGSNMLEQRIHINLPSAIRVAIGKLEGYQLDFAAYSRNWKGAPATIARNPDHHVWGVVWRMNRAQLRDLDYQEGVQNGVYFRFETPVHLTNGTTLPCYVYEITNIPFLTQPIESLTPARRPSPAYVDTVLKGAHEARLPNEYITFLERIPTNGYHGELGKRLAQIQTEEVKKQQ